MEDQQEDRYIESKEDEAVGRHAGREIVSWLVDEYVRHERGTWWYVLSGLACLALLIYSVLTQNFLFAIIVIMFAVITGLSAMREPRKMLINITDLGVGIGDDFYPYKTIQKFWILYEPPEVKNVYFEFKLSPMRRLTIPLHEQNPIDVRSALVRFLDEDLEMEDEPMSEIIGKVLKF
jgi:hypothetical protein